MMRILIPHQEQHMPVTPQQVCIQHITLVAYYCPCPDLAYYCPSPDLAYYCPSPDLAYYCSCPGLVYYCLVLMHTNHYYIAKPCSLYILTIPKLFYLMIAVVTRHTSCATLEHSYYRHVY